MKEEELYLQNAILANIYAELNKQNITLAELCEFLLKNSLMKKSRIDNILHGTNKRIITLQEIGYIAYALNLDNPGYLLKNIK